MCASLALETSACFSGTTRSTSRQKPVPRRQRNSQLRPSSPLPPRTTPRLRLRWSSKKDVKDTPAPFAKRYSTHIPSRRSPRLPDRDPAPTRLPGPGRPTQTQQELSPKRASRSLQPESVHPSSEPDGAYQSGFGAGRRESVLEEQSEASSLRLIPTVTVRKVILPYDDFLINDCQTGCL
jgi:hypothetical protein